MGNNVDGKDFIIGAVVGGLLGAMAALLLAPKSGRELRQDLTEQYGTISEKTQQIASTVSEKTQQIASTVGEKTASIAKSATTHTNEWVDKAKDVAGTVIDEVKIWSEKRKQAGENAESSDEVVAESEQEAK
ncbi:YtxH domain-containing protein [Paenibacillus psychroresistens]|uniref:YtxH domain-containing protein n=1 Tax=Paenibacillus psychroresistens TaxID=1778678 RepID=A0A6B8RP66_9BACL|nr:YtxH domain-containing protein [Paenibacillus psychroresistens]QGQ97482.1 YtxH domain-containing protein [Paenibacillus psychroresistens]